MTDDDTIRVHAPDLLRYLRDNDHLRKQVDELQRSNNALLERALAAEASMLPRTQIFLDEERRITNKALADRDAAIARAEAAEKELRIVIGKAHSVQDEYRRCMGERDAARAYAGRWKALARRLRERFDGAAEAAAVLYGDACARADERDEAQATAARLAASCNEVIRTCEAERDAARAELAEANRQLETSIGCEHRVAANRDAIGAELATLRKAAWRVANTRGITLEYDALSAAKAGLIDALGARREGE